MDFGASSSVNYASSRRDTKISKGDRPRDERERESVRSVRKRATTREREREREEKEREREKERKKVNKTRRANRARERPVQTPLLPQLGDEND